MMEIETDQNMEGKELSDSFDENDIYISALGKIKEAFDDKKNKSKTNERNRLLQHVKRLFKKDNLLG